MQLLKILTVVTQIRLLELANLHSGTSAKNELVAYCIQIYLPNLRTGLADDAVFFYQLLQQVGEKGTY